MNALRAIHLIPSILLATVGFSARAVDFTGHWLGTGQMTQAGMTGNHTSPCSKIEIKMEHSPSQLMVRSYHAICGTLDSDWGPYPFEIRGTEIYEDGERTGQIEGDLLKTLQASGGVQYAFNLRLPETAAGQVPVLATYYGVRNLVGTIVIEGNLAPAP